MEDREVFVWSVDLDLTLDATAGLHALLSDDERCHVARFRFQRDQQRFIIAHAALRDLLGHYVGIRPDQVQFVTNTFGKPGLAPDHGSELRFNLSHSGDLALIAVAGADVGVDVERLKADTDCLEIAQHWFSLTEALELRSIPSWRRKQAFFDRWTRKEAWAKARGEGLSMPEATFAAGPDRDWALFGLRPAPGYVGALAIRGTGWQLRERRWGAEVPSRNALVF